MSARSIRELPDRGPGLKAASTEKQWDFLVKNAVATIHCKPDACDECAPWDGETMRLPEAEEKVPFHYNCKCHWTYDWEPSLRALSVTSLLRRASERTLKDTMSSTDTVTKTATATGVVKETPNGEEQDRDDPEYIRVPISSTSRDRDGDRFSEEGLEDLRDQIQNQRRRVFENHGRDREAGLFGLRYDWVGIIGAQEDAEIEEEDGDQVLYSYVRPNPENEQADKLVRYLEAGMPVGFSVGFRVLEREEDEDGDQTFNRTDLLETSAVGIQSNPDAVPNTDALGSAEVLAKGAVAAAPDGADLDEDILASAMVSELVGQSAGLTPGDDRHTKTGTGDGAGTHDHDSHTTMSDSNDDNDELLERVISLQEDQKEAQDELRERIADLEDDDTVQRVVETEDGETEVRTIPDDEADDVELRDLVEGNQDDLDDLRDDVSDIKEVVTDDDTEAEDAETKDKGEASEDDTEEKDTEPEGDDTGTDTNGEWMV